MKIGTKVVVTTKHRGVFFGELVAANGSTVVLKGCRNCLYWDKSVKGFLGLAATGPLEGSLVGPAAEETELRSVTSTTKCSEAAIARWESEQWTT
jgi:hypothetical protein